ncbi:hypothetical protein BpHYR1_034669 [Brachionus plicatilis]|uniref:Uncharacterized protein n=1 Tax=Brachionus plicatilis TaxID=10195 RepID=A0A3M7S1P1_BRAPC|nr:hypothetical protein BpHYR1_034669 [Brachionus plicatilis]
MSLKIVQVYKALNVLENSTKSVSSDTFFRTISKHIHNIFIAEDNRNSNPNFDDVGNVKF